MLRLWALLQLVSAIQHQRLATTDAQSTLLASAHNSKNGSLNLNSPNGTQRGQPACMSILQLGGMSNMVLNTMSMAVAMGGLHKIHVKWNSTNENDLSRLFDADLSDERKCPDAKPLCSKDLCAEWGPIGTCTDGCCRGQAKTLPFAFQPPTSPSSVTLCFGGVIWPAGAKPTTLTEQLLTMFQAMRPSSAVVDMANKVATKHSLRQDGPKGQQRQDYIGVHARLGDRYDADVNGDSNPVPMFAENHNASVFFTQVDKHLSKLNSTGTKALVFLSTDTRDMRDKFKERYGDRLVCLDEFDAGGKTTRENPTLGLRNIMLLAQSKVIVGTPGSSFSLLAGLVGRKQGVSALLSRLLGTRQRLLNTESFNAKVALDSQSRTTLMATNEVDVYF